MRLHHGAMLMLRRILQPKLWENHGHGVQPSVTVDSRAVVFTRSLLLLHVHINVF